MQSSAVRIFTLNLIPNCSLNQVIAVNLQFQSVAFNLISLFLRQNQMLHKRITHSSSR